MDKKKILWGIILTAVLATGVGLQVSLRTSEARIASLNEPGDLRDLVNLSDRANIQERIHATGSPEWNAALQGIDSYAGTRPVLNAACAKESFGSACDASLQQICTVAADNCTVVSQMGSFCPVASCAPGEQIPIELVSLSLVSVLNPAQGTIAKVTVSCNTLDPDPNTRCLASAYDTNICTPGECPGTDPFIIVNAEPYFYIRYWWWDFVSFRLAFWGYWWHDSHNHPNWYWGVYWWWRTYVRYYIGFWIPWWWYYWHWGYWRYWFWWSTFFPYVDF